MMNQNDKCSQCLQLFSGTKTPLKLPNCQHNICQLCLNQIITNQEEMIVCAFCSNIIKGQEIKMFPINQEVKASIILFKSEPIIKQDNLMEGVLLQNNQETNSFNKDICKDHHVIMDIICISDKIRICPHCALFGDHKNHRFKRLQDFQKEVAEKSTLFAQISKLKNIVLSEPNNDVQNVITQNILLKKQQIKNQIKQTIEQFINSLKRTEQRCIDEVDKIFTTVQCQFNRNNYYKKYLQFRQKLQKWQKDCANNLSIIQRTSDLQTKINNFYESPLELVTLGNIYIEQFTTISKEINTKANAKIKQIKLLIDSQMNNNISKCIQIQKSSIPFATGMQFIEEQISTTNPFLDCTSSEIDLNSISTLLNNVSLQVDQINMINTCNQTLQLAKTIKRSTLGSKNQIKSIKSIEKKINKDIKDFKEKDSKDYIMPQSPVQKKRSVISPVRSNGLKNSRMSQISNIRSLVKPAKNTSLKDILPEQIKPYDLKEPEKIYAQFSKNTLTDHFDISYCNLPSEKVIQYVHRARRIHKIKGLKLCSNRLNTLGFEKMLQFLKGVSNINLANNELNEGVIDLLLKNRDLVDNLRMINLSHNPISFDKKLAYKIEQLKRLGIIVVL